MGDIISFSNYKENFIKFEFENVEFILDKGVLYLTQLKEGKNPRNLFIYRHFQPLILTKNEKYYKIIGEEVIWKKSFYEITKKEILDLVDPSYIKHNRKGKSYIPECTWYRRAKKKPVEFILNVPWIIELL